MGKKIVNSLMLILIALPIGIMAGAIDTLFGNILNRITDFRNDHFYFLIPFLGFIGAIMVWCYEKFGGKSSKAMALIFEAGHEENTDIPLRLIPFSMVGTWLTHLFGGSAGREGVAVQIGGAVANNIGKRIPMKIDSKLLIITGMAAGFAGLFRTPIAATFFALEVLTVGVLERKAVLPALTAAYTASYVSGLFGMEKFSFALSDTMAFSWMFVLKIVIIGILFGMMGGLFSFCLHKTKDMLTKTIKKPILRIFIVGILISILSVVCFGGRYSGLGTNLISMSFSKGIYSWDFMLKFIFTILTLSAGFQGGEVTPLFSIGASLGVLLASVFGLPTAFVAALGYGAVFGSGTNTFIAPMMIGAEVFGFEYLPYFVVVCAISYVFNGGLSIYRLQKKD